MSKKCAIVGCGKPRRGREWCNTHYKRWYRHGTPEPGNTRRATKPELIERLEGFVSPEPNSGCWLWTGAVMANGYGVFGVAGYDTALAHRVSFLLHKGPIQAGLVLDHKCRTRCCVNPDHLEPVTTAENLARGLRATGGYRKTHCRNGHEYTPETTIRDWSGARRCKTCRVAFRREYDRRYYQEKFANA